MDQTHLQPYTPRPLPRPKGSARYLLYDLDRMLDDQISRCEVNVAQLAASLGFDRFKLNRRMKSAIGMSVSEYIQQRRLRKACTLIRRGGHSMIEVARACGFEDNSYFSRFFKKETGMTPSQFLGR